MFDVRRTEVAMLGTQAGCFKCGSLICRCEDDSLGGRVRKLEKDYDGVRRLCGEIIATFLVEGNQKVFESLPQEWHNIVQVWKRRFDRLT